MMSLAALRAIVAAGRELASASTTSGSCARSTFSLRSPAEGPASELAVNTVMHALRTCGLAGYRNDGEFSDGTPSARRAFRANHDQQRPHPRHAAAPALMAAVPATIGD